MPERVSAGAVRRQASSASARAWQAARRGDGGRRRSRRARLGRRRPKRGSRRRAAGPLTSCEQALTRGGPRGGRTSPTGDPADPSTRGRELATPDGHPPERDVEWPEEERQEEQDGPQVRVAVRGGQVVRPGVERRLHRLAARGRSQAGEERFVRAEEPVLGGGRGDQSDRPPKGRRSGPGLGDPQRIRARIDLAEWRLVDARRHLDEGDVLWLQVRPDDRRPGGVEVARRAVGLDALDVEGGRTVLRIEAGLDAVGLLARERPAHELREEPVEPTPRQPVLGPAAGRVRGPRHGSPQAVLPLREQRIVTGRDEDRLRGRLGRRAVVAEELRQTSCRDRAGSATTRSGSGRTAPPRSAGRTPAGSP